MAADEAAATALLEVSVRAPQVTAEILMAAIRAAITAYNSPAHGQQSLRKLNLQNVGLDRVKFESIERSDLREIRHALKEYGVDFSITKGNGDERTIHFKSRDTGRMVMALEKVDKELAEKIAKKSTREVIEDAKREANVRESQRDGPDLVQETSRRQEAQR